MTTTAAAIKLMICIITTTTDALIFPFPTIYYLVMLYAILNGWANSSCIVDLASAGVGGATGIAMLLLKWALEHHFGIFYNFPPLS
jgi:hypothetical protein